MSSSSGGLDDCASPREASPPPTRSDPWCSLMPPTIRRRRPSVLQPFAGTVGSGTDSVMPRIPKRLLALGGLAAGGAAFARKRRAGRNAAPAPAPAAAAPAPTEAAPPPPTPEPAAAAPPHTEV